MNMHDSRWTVRSLLVWKLRNSWHRKSTSDQRKCTLRGRPNGVVCGAGGVIGRFFLEDDEGVAATVNGDRYHRHMVTSWLWPQVIGIQNLWFQQDAPRVKQSTFLQTNSRDEWSRCEVTTSGLPGPANLSLWLFFCWGYVESRVYAYKYRTIQ